MNHSSKVRGSDGRKRHFAPFCGEQGVECVFLERGTRFILPSVLQKMGHRGASAEVGVWRGSFSDSLLRHWPHGGTHLAIDPCTLPSILGCGAIAACTSLPSAMHMLCTWPLGSQVRNLRGGVRQEQRKGPSGRLGAVALPQVAAGDEREVHRDVRVAPPPQPTARRDNAGVPTAVGLEPATHSKAAANAPHAPCTHPHVYPPRVRCLIQPAAQPLACHRGGAGAV